MFKILKRFLPKSLLGRSLLIICLPLILVQLISAWVFYDRHVETVTRRMAASLAGDVVTITNHLRDYPGPKNQAWILAEARRHMALDVRLERGAKLPSAPVADTDNEIHRTFREIIRLPYILDSEAPSKQIRIRVETPGGVLHVLASRKRLYTVTTTIFVSWSVGSSILLLLVAVLFMRNQVRPIRRLAEAAEGFGKGRQMANFKPSGAREVRQAAQAFIRMRDRIKRQISQRTEMLAGVSHDLRTPLTRMRLLLELMPNSPEAKELRANIKEMELTVDEYLAFARGEGSEAPVDTDLTALLGEVIEGARHGGRRIDLRAVGKLTVPVRPNAFRRCVTNIIVNAFSHAETVSVEARRRGRVVRIVIDDDGPGIPSARREEVFKAFVRLDDARSPDSAGVGLGLTIARDIMRGHGGEITLSESPSGGLRAELSLPI